MEHVRFFSIIFYFAFQFVTKINTIFKDFIMTETCLKRSQSLHITITSGL